MMVAGDQTTTMNRFFPHPAATMNEKMGIQFREIYRNDSCSQYSGCSNKLLVLDTLVLPLL